MKTSEALDGFAVDFPKAQGEMEPAIKNATNPAYPRSHYANLPAVWEAIGPPSAKYGFGSLQEATTVMHEGKFIGIAVTTRILHKSGQWIEFDLLMVPFGKFDAHGVGSATSYAKRYALSAAWGVVAEEDDDGNEAVKPATSMSVQAPSAASVVVAEAAVSAAPARSAGEKSEPLLVKKVDKRWHDQAGKQLGHVTFSDGQKYKVYAPAIYKTCVEVEGADKPVVIKLTRGGNGEYYVSSVEKVTPAPQQINTVEDAKAAIEKLGKQAKPLTDDQIPF